MVMDRPLSPQSVGREFVRQYYTLLNEAPAHLHRFYNNSSSFIHGGLGPTNREMPVVVGQKQIHQQIQQLNFRDCHAKISQVDSQATLDNGVVVQVSGELSNAGQPMRRFTQTFVLAAQSPKKYYVHNDIFRYQDLLSDEELETRSEAEEDQEPEVQQNDIHAPEAPGAYYPSVNQVVNGLSETKNHEDLAPADPPQQVYNNIEIMQQAPPSQLVETVAVEPASQPNQGPFVLVEMQQNAAQPEAQPEYHIQSQPPVQQQVASNEPKTYANLVKQGHHVGGTVYYNTSPVAASQAPAMLSTEPTSPPPQTKTENKGFELRSNSNQQPKPQRNDIAQRNNYNSVSRQNHDDTSNGNSYGGDGDRRRNNQYSDNHQVFVGNIPHNASEGELKELFGQFGNIIDLKILSKPGNKGPGMMKLPFYGFIIFEEVSSVQAVLNAKPIMFPDESGVKLNVEEKKARRGGEGGGGGRGGRGGLIGRGGGTPPRGGPRGGGGMRFNAPLQNRR